MLDFPSTLTPALAVLSLRNMRRGQKPHVSLNALREYHALCLHLRRYPPQIGKVTLQKLPPPTNASPETLLSFFESQARPEDFREAAADRRFNLEMERKYPTEAARA